MRKLFLLSILSCCCFLTFRADVLANDADTAKSDLPVHYLGEVVVTGEKADKPPTAITEVTASAIEYRGATTAGEAISFVPGVWVSTGYKNSTEVRLRGFDSKQVLILVDGRPVNLPYYGSLDLSSLPVGNISKIKVIKGPAASLYGANTMGGVVNIVTKRSAQSRTGDLILSFGEADTWNSILNYGTAIGDLDFWVSAGKSRSDGFNLPEDFEPARWEDGQLRENSDYDRLNLDGKLNYRLSSTTDLSLSLGYFDADKGLPGGVDEDLPRDWRFVEWKRRYLDLAGESYLGDRWYVKAKLYYDGCKNKLVDYDSTFGFDSVHDSWDIGGSLLGRLTWRGDNESTWGLNLRQDGIDKRMDLDEEWETHKTLTSSLFTQSNIQASEWISLDLGLAWNILTSEGLDEAKGSLDPTVGAWFSVLERLRLRVSASRATRFPTLNHLYGFDSGNPDLNPEQAIKLEGGAEFEVTEGLQTKLDFFRANVKDLIDRKGRGYKYTNLDKVILQGIEAGVNGRLKERFSFQLDYTYLDAYEDKTEYWLPYRPSHKIDYDLSYISRMGLTVYTSGQYVSRRVTPHPESETLPSFFVTNLRVSQRVFDHFHPFLELKNVFDENYEEEKGFPMPGRTFLGGLKIAL
jgi:outer membrane cobalamin receptor